MKFSHRKPATLSHYQRLVLDALQTVMQGLEEALDLQRLAAPACMAPLHFHRVFRGLVGETPLQLHRRLRLERAAWQLATSTDTVLRIALQAGYDTHEAFTRAFGAAFGRSPSAHRALAAAGRASCEGSAHPAPHPLSHPLSNRLQAACGLHADGPRITLPADLTTLLQPQGALLMHVEIKTRPALRVAACAHQGPYNTIGAAFDRLGSLAGPAGLMAPPAAHMVAIYFDDPESVPAAQLRSAAGVTVAAGTALPTGLHEVLLPAGRWACTVHQGSYQGLGDCWQRLLGHWLPGSGHRLGQADCYELYLNHPGHAGEDQLLTELYVPLAEV